MSQIAQRLQALGLPLTPANPTAFDYQPAIRHGKLICVAGQIPKLDKTTLVCTGRLGESVNADQARLAVRTCVLNALAWVDALTHGDQARVAQILRVNYFFQVPASHSLSLSELADAGSGLLVEVFGEPGRHPRSVIGVVELPRNAPVLIDMDVLLE